MRTAHAAMRADMRDRASSGRSGWGTDSRPAPQGHLTDVERAMRRGTAMVRTVTFPSWDEDAERVVMRTRSIVTLPPRSLAPASYDRAEEDRISAIVARVFPAGE